MSYQVRFTDTTKTPITVEDQTINTEKGVAFIGKNYPGYSQYIAENFLHLLENFAKNSAPSNPITGQLWYDTTLGVNNQLKVFNGTNWVAAGNVKKATTAPTTSVVGDLWVDTDNQQLKLYNGSSWILVGPDYSTGQQTGAKVDSITDTTEQSRPVIKLLVKDSIVGIISEKEFVPKATIPGFSTIKQGINVSTLNFNSSTAGTKFWGTSEKADALVVNNVAVAAANFLRGDKDSVTNYQLSVRSNSGINIGASSDLSIAIDANTAVIYNKISGSSIDFKLKGGTSNNTVLRIDSSTNVGVNKTNPGESLDVTGNIRTDNKLIVTGTATDSINTAGGLSVTGASSLDGGLSVTGTSSLQSTNPKTTLTYDLGTSALKWNTIYAGSIGDSINPVSSVFATNFYGDINGNVNGSAISLVSAKNFSLGDELDGLGNVITPTDVTSATVAFDGTSDVVLTATISSSFIANKTSTTDSLTTDELLINRSGSLRRITKEKFFANVATVPAGAIFPFAGTTVPTGYLLCDGSEVLISNYPVLFAAIQYSFKPISSLVGVGTFAVPDLRGRFPLGLDNMGGTSADRVTDPAADAIGGVGGVSEVTIDRNNLPEHVHNLKGNAGSQYYSFAPRTGTPPDTNAQSANGLTATGQGQLMTDSGGIYTDDLPSSTLSVPIPVINHYQAMRYIIFTGRVA